MHNTVTVRDIVFGDGIPKVCIPVTAVNEKELYSQLDLILQSPFDLIEWRADFYQECEGEDWILKPLQILREKLQNKPLLFTFRTKEEGGERSISMLEYEILCLSAAHSQMVDFVDVELNRGDERFARLAEQIQKYNCRMIGSFHDFYKTPSKEELVKILTRMQELGADITKAAVMPQNARDVMELLEATLCMKEKNADRPYVTMSMSRLGAISRLAGGLNGSAFTFATAGRASAPGQLEAKALSVLLPNL